MINLSSKMECIQCQTNVNTREFLEHLKKCVDDQGHSFFHMVNNMNLHNNPLLVQDDPK